MQAYTTRTLKTKRLSTVNQHRHRPRVATPALLKTNRAAPPRASPF